MMKCPVCKEEIVANPLRSWYFNVFDVDRYECPSCKVEFNIYNLHSPIRNTTHYGRVGILLSSRSIANH